MSRRVCVVITARPSYARVKTVLEALRADVGCDLMVVAGASALLERYGRVVDILRADGFPPDVEAWSVLEGESTLTAARGTGVLVSELASAFARLRPAVVVTIADRYETLATAIAAAYQHIPLLHLQGGEVTGSIDDKVRAAVTALADEHAVSTTQARARLILQGVDPARVHVTGCPSIDLAKRAVMHGTWPRQIVVLQHPVTDEAEDAGEQIEETIAAVRGLELPVCWYWPGQDAGSGALAKRMRLFHQEVDACAMDVTFLRNEQPEQFLSRLAHAACIVGNSSVAIREGSYLGTPAVNIGTRQQGRERGPNVIDVGYNRHAISDAIQTQLAHGRYPWTALYGDGHAGQRIAQVLMTMDLKAGKAVAA